MLFVFFIIRTRLFFNLNDLYILNRSYANDIISGHHTQSGILLGVQDLATCQYNPVIFIS